jgi:hypothetical protein
MVDGKDLVRKLYILDSVNGEVREDMFTEAAKELGVKLKIDMDRYRRSRNLPENYDFYFLHLSDVDIASVDHINREQPWSYLVGISGGYFHGRGEDGELFDKKLSALIIYDSYVRLLKEMLESE